MENLSTLTEEKLKGALWEIRNLAFALFESLPQEHKFLFAEVMG